MKLFRTVYYSVLAVLVVALFTLSCVDIGGTRSTATGFTAAMTDAAAGHVEQLTKNMNSGSIYDPDAHAAKVDYLTDTLRGFGLDDVTDAEDALTPELNGARPGFARIKMTLTGAEKYEWETAYYGKEPASQSGGTTLTDIAVYVPATGGQPSGDVVMMMAHYDSVRMGVGANDNLTSVGAMLETILYLTGSGLDFNNDFLFLLTDGEEYGMLGAYAFTKQFDGFTRDGRNAYARVGLGCNFESRGNDGTVIMFQSSANNYKLIKNWAGIRSTLFASSVADFAYSLMDNYTDFSVFGSEIPALNFANIGGGEVYHTQNDATPSATVIANHGAMMFGLIDAFGDTALDQLKSGTDAVFFSYLDWGTAVYSYAVAYVLGALLLGLVAAALVYGAIKKTLNLPAMLKGLAVVVLAALLSVAFGYAAYYVIGAILALCGVVDIHALGSLMFASIPLTVFAGLLVTVFSVFLFIFLKRLFYVKAGDVVRGNVLLWSLVGAILSFAAPAVSYYFVWVALFEALALLATAIFKPVYKARFGEDMDRLFLYIVPVVFLLPMLLGLFLLLGDALGAAMYPVVTVLPVLFAAFITPYFDYLRGALDRLVKKLPGASVRTVETVTATVGELRRDADNPQAQALLRNPANAEIIKKGDGGEITYRKTTRHFEKLTYQNWHGIVALTLVAAILVFCFAGQKPAFADNISGKANFDRPYHDDAVVYVVDKDADAADTHYWLVGDLDAYQYIRVVQKMDWDASLGRKGAYKLTDSANVSKANEYLPTVDNVAVDQNTTSFTVRPTVDSMRFSLTFDEAADVEQVTVHSWTNAGESHEETYYPRNGKLTIDDLSSITTVTIEAAGSTAYAGNVVFTGKQIAYAYDEQIGDNTELRDFTGLWADVQAYYADSELAQYLKGGIQIKNYTLNITA